MKQHNAPDDVDPSQSHGLSRIRGDETHNAPDDVRPCKSHGLSRIRGDETVCRVLEGGWEVPRIEPN